MSKIHQVKNQDFLEIWDDYVNDKTKTPMPARKAALLPLYVSIKNGAIIRERITSQKVKSFYNKYKNKIPDYMRTQTHLFPNIDDVVKEYIDHFNGPDKGEGPAPLNPLDIATNRPTYMLYILPKPKAKDVVWQFSDGVQFSCENDGVGPFRNFLPICTLNNDRALLVLNRHCSNHPDLKFNLHVTISQMVKKDGKKIEVKTPIIIDPGGDNPGSRPD